MIAGVVAESGSRRGRRMLGASASAAFAALVVGSNVPGSMLPMYAERMSLSTFTVSALFAAYLVALVVTFTVMARTRLTRRAWLLLPAALVGGVVADAALIAGGDDVVFLFVGRFLTGTCVGVATGATATIAVAARGEKGRTIAASGAIFGSFVGLILGAVVAENFPGPTVTPYVIHMSLLVAIGVLLVISLARARTLLRDELGPGPLRTDGHADTSARARAAGYGIGLAGWAIGGLAVGILPTAVREQTGGTSLLVGVSAPIVLLLVAWLAPLVFAARHTALPPSVSLALIALGAVACAAGVVSSRLELVVIGCLSWGLGQGFAYSCGLRLLTRGVSAVEQGRVASKYASFCYGLTAILTLTTGAVSTGWGSATGMATAGAILVVLCSVVALLGRGRWENDGDNAVLMVRSQVGTV
ncbi:MULTISPECIES: MFS transporter [unclassified Rhodococcus (in: high G+C Gram-positive bacteria)]|nr:MULTISPECIES: MFS transporter [unclassified Rhodococcus (in: high G+C Gram-positive bacteria)]